MINILHPLSVCRCLSVWNESLGGRICFLTHLTDGSHLTTKSDSLLCKGCRFPGFLARAFQTGSRTSGELGTRNTLRSWPLGKWSANGVTEISHEAWAEGLEAVLRRTHVSGVYFPPPVFLGCACTGAQVSYVSTAFQLRHLKAWGKRIVIGSQGMLRQVAEDPIREPLFMDLWWVLGWRV